MLNLTGMRWARRTQVKIGFTLAKPCWVGWALDTLMPRAMLAHVAGDLCRIAHQLDLSRVAHGNPVEAGFLEIGIDPERVAVDDRDAAGASLCKVTALDQEIGDVTVYGRAHFRSF